MKISRYLTLLGVVLLTPSCATDKTPASKKKSGPHSFFTNKYDSFDAMTNAEKEFRNKVDNANALEWFPIVFKADINSYVPIYQIRGVCYCSSIEEQQEKHQDGICDVLKNRTLSVEYIRGDEDAVLKFEKTKVISEQIFDDLKWEENNDDLTDHSEKFNLTNSNYDVVASLLLKNMSEESKTVFLSSIKEACRYDNIVDFGI